jgi:hypothetical protein
MRPNYPGNLNGNDRRYNRPQNNYDQGLANRGPGGIYRKNGMNRKKPGQDTDTAIVEGISAVKEYLKEITVVQKQLAGSQEKIATAQQAHSEAMQQIAAAVKQFLGTDKTAPAATESDETQSTVSQSAATENEPVEEIAVAPENEPVEEIAAAPDNDPVEEIAAVSESEPEAARSLPEEMSEKTEVPADTSTGRLAEAALKIIAEMRGNRVSFEKIADHLEAEGVPMVSGNGKWNRRIVSKVYKGAVL